MSDHQIVYKTGPTFYFVGVTTGSSSIMQVFPLWMEILGRPEVVIEGIDHKIHDDPAAYRATVAHIKHDPLALGGLVTTHKMDLYAAAHDMFDYFDPYAQRTHEISSISKAEGRLEGHAKDPLTAGLALRAIIGAGYFGRSGGQVLCLGAGGAGVATLLHLVNQTEPTDRPARFIAVDRDPARLDHMRQMAQQFETDITVDYVRTSDPRQNDALVAQLPPGSLVINATGMGKDTPGSPLTDAAVFPQNGIAWEFNYRGELDFMHQALRQKKARNLRVEDGWLYFLHGWSQVIAQVLHLELTEALFAQLNESAAATRS